MPTSTVYVGSASLFKNLPDELAQKYCAGAQIQALAFDQQLRTMNEEIGIVQEWNLKYLRANAFDVTADFKTTLEAQQAASIARRDHTGNWAEQLSSKGIFTVLTLLDRAWGLDRDPAVRAALVALGYPMNGATSVYQSLGYGTGDAFGTDRSNARRWLIDAAICTNGGTYSAGASGLKPAPAGPGPLWDDFIDAVWAWIEAFIIDWKARVGFPGNTMIIPQLMNGPESSRDLSMDPVWPHNGGGYFNNIARDLKQPLGTALVNAISAGAGGNAMPTGTPAEIDAKVSANYAWASKVIAHLLYGRIDASDVLNVESVHWYRQGQYRPRFCGNPFQTFVGEFGFSRRFTELRNLGAGSDRDSLSAGSDLGDDDYDADPAAFILAPRDLPWVLQLGRNTVNVPANANSTQIRAAINALPGVYPEQAGVAQDMTIEFQINNGVPITTLLDSPPDGIACNGYHIRFGKAISSSSDSQSKKKPNQRLTSPTAGVQVYSHMEGGQIDRGPALRQFVRDLVGHGFKQLTYHTPIDPRGSNLWEANDGSTIKLWTRGPRTTPGTYEHWRTGGTGEVYRTRNVHDGGPFFEDEEGHYKFMWAFGRYMSGLNTGEAEDVVDAGGDSFDMLVASAPLFDSSIRADTPLALVPGNVIGSTMIVTYSGSGRGTIQCRNGHVMLVEITDRNSARVTKSLREFEDSLDKSPPTVEETLKWLKDNGWRKRDLNPGMHFFAPPTGTSARKDKAAPTNPPGKEEKPPAPESKPETAPDTKPAADETPAKPTGGDDTALPPDAGGKNEPSTPPEKGKEVK